MLTYKQISIGYQRNLCRLTNKKEGFLEGIRR